MHNWTSDCLGELEEYLIFPLNSSKLGEVLKELVSKILFSKVENRSISCIPQACHLFFFFFVKTVLGDHLAFESSVLLRDKKP